MNDTMSPVYVTDEVIDGMMNGYKDLAVVYSGDATVILDENEDMSFYMPEQATNIWCDAMVIPANAENPCSPTSSSTICSPMRPHLTIRRRWGILLPTQRSLRR